MPDASLTFALVDIMAMPLLGFWALMATKLCVGDALRKAERRFFLALIIASFVTLRTVMRLDDVWIVHTVTLAAMILGVFIVPSRDSLVAGPATVQIPPA